MAFDTARKNSSGVVGIPPPSVAVAASSSLLVLGAVVGALLAGSHRQVVILSPVVGQSRGHGCVSGG